MLTRSDQQHQHPVDAVAVHPFGRRLPGLAGLGLDAELVDLDMPDRAASRRGQPVEQRGQVSRIARSAGCAPIARSTGSNQRSMSPFSGL